MKKKLSLFVFLCYCLFGFAQERVDILIDSLTLVSSPVEKSKISREIAYELKFSDWNRALHYLEFSEEQIEKVNTEEDRAAYYNDVGQIYYDKDALDIALDYFLKSYAILKDKENSETKNLLNHNLAVLYGRLKKEDEALPFFREAYNYAVKHNDSITVAKAQNNIGTIFFHLNQIDSAKYYYNKALKILKHHPKEYYLSSYLYTNLGRSYTEEKEFDLATKNFQKAIAALGPHKDERGSAWVHNTVSHFFYKTNQPDSAVYYAAKATESLKNQTYTFENQNAVHNLYKAYLLAEDYKSASKYFELYDQIRDSLNIVGKSINIEKIEIEQAYKAKEEIRNLKEREEEFKIYIVGLCLFVALLIMIMLVVRFRNKLIKSQLKNELIESQQNELDAKLELKNKELIGKAMVEIHRTEIIQEILQDLKNIKRKAVKKETQQAIDYILKRLQKDIHSDIWQEFEVAFEQVHESFYKNLQQQHPDLTTRDKRLCAMLKLNLSSKEVAQLTGQSFKSVENARTRLRKKLNLTNTKTDLAVYLSSF